MNVERLRRVRARILREPNRFDMDEWIQGSDGETCGTVCCIGGHAALDARYVKPYVSGGMVFYARTPRGQKASEKLDRAEFVIDEVFAAALGIKDADAAARLFLHYRWPTSFREALKDAESAKERAKVAAKRITHFIKTKGRE